MATGKFSPLLLLHGTRDLLFADLAFVVFLSCFLPANEATEIRKPRGVSVSKASLYIPDKDFTCFDGSLTIPFLHVNDDYCDCPDGSDEPGTSACPNGFFHCTNAGFKPQNIPSSFVNDGVCDCCDAADEYLGKISCKNTCQELGKAERIEQQKQAEIFKIGYESKIQSIKRGKQIKLEKRERLKQLEIDKQEAESIRGEKEKLKRQAEELEKLALDQYNKQKAEEEEASRRKEKEQEEEEALQMFTMLDSNQDKKIHFSELQVRQTFDQNRDGAVSEEEAKFFLDNSDSADWDSFVSSAWPKMKPFFMMEKGLFKPPEKNLLEPEDGAAVTEPNKGVGSVEDVTSEYQRERQNVEDDGERVADHQEEEEEEGEGEEEEEEEGTETVGEEVESEGGAPQQNTEPQYDEETQTLVNAANEARSQFEEADRAVRDIQRQISQVEEYLAKDYGPEEEFAPLEGECFEFTDREYVYKLCPFDQASQQPRSGESETKLGQWGRWGGPEEDKYRIMVYEKGQSCWNGPQRSAHVKLKCGTENVITSVLEPNKCEYHFEFSTPSACKMAETISVEEERVHDEL